MGKFLIKVVLTILKLTILKLKSKLYLYQITNKTGNY